MQNNNEHLQKEDSFLSKFIFRPVLSWVLNIVIILVGLVSWHKLSVRELPKLDLPVIRVETDYSGAAPAIVESQITNLLEESFAGCEGLDYISSNSSNGKSTISLHFKSDRRMEDAAADVRDRLMKAKDSLPQGLRDPVMTKASTDSQSLIRLVAYGENYKLGDIADYLQRYAKGILESVTGVAAVRISGGGGSSDSGSYQIHALVDPRKLESFGLTVLDVRNAIDSQSFKNPLGDIIKHGLLTTITLDQKASSLEDYGNIIVKNSKNGFVKLKDVCDMRLITDDPDSIVRYNGKPAVFVGIIAQSTANPMQIAADVNKKLIDIRKSLPKDLAFDVAYDRSEFIDNSIKSVYGALVEAIVCVFLVMLLFLRSWRATFIPMITIPICIFGGFFMLFMVGFTINILTLLAVVLAIGLVVDDAIVVLENIYRHIEEGMEPWAASVRGIKEIQFSVIAMTLTLVAVYAPITLSSGIVGKLFTEFAVTLAFTVLISGFVALVLTPMLCSRLLRHEVETKKWQKVLSRWIDSTDIYYSKALDWSLDNSKKVFAFCIFLGFAGFLMANYAFPRMLFPQMDMSMIMLNLQGPSGSSVEYTDSFVKKIEPEVIKVKDLKNYSLTLESRNRDDSIYISLSKPEKRRKSCQQILDDLNARIAPLQSGLDIRGQCYSGMLGGGSAKEASLTFVIQSQKSYDEIELIARRVLQALRSHPAVGNNAIRTSRVSPEQSYEVSVNKSKAASLNIRMRDVGDILSFVMRGQPPADRFERDGKRYPMRVWVNKDFRAFINNVAKFHVRSTKSPDGRSEPGLVSMKEILKIKETSERPSVFHYEGMRSYQIIADIDPGYSVTAVYKEVTEMLDSILPQGYKYSPTDNLRQTINEGSNVLLIFGLSLLFIFLIMAAQFESFLDPLMIMLSVPLALAGGIFTLWPVPGSSMNIFTQIALITLIGLITKHGILIVDFANQSFSSKKGKTLADIVESVKDGCLLRLRPILMTTAAMVLGALPLAISSGTGYEVRNQIGWVIVGGMSIGTLFTLFLMPCIYVLFRSWQYKIYR